MYQYLQLVNRVLTDGRRKSNRTGIDTIGVHGAHMAFNMDDGFPAVTTKKLPYRVAFAEMLGFLRGYSSAADFRELGCRVWDQNANENQSWLDNPNRKGEDDLGRVYGVQARQWAGKQHCEPRGGAIWSSASFFDQLRKVYNHLRQGIDDRREIVTHWNPGELDEMALPPCHMLYQFGLEPLTIDERCALAGIPPDETFGDLYAELGVMGVPNNRLNLSMYQRSCDMGLGVPFNIAGYSWLLHVMARITGTVPGTFNYFMHDVHIYENHIEALREQLTRAPGTLPTLAMNQTIISLEDMETWVTLDDFTLEDYDPLPAIKMEMAV